MFEMIASFSLCEHFYRRTFQPALGTSVCPRLLSAGRRVYRTKYNYVCVMIYTDRHWQAWFGALGTPEVMQADPRFASMTTRTESIDAICAELAEILQGRTTQEWLDIFDDADIPAMPVDTPDSLIDDPHLRDVGFFKQVDHPTEGAIWDMSVPANRSQSQPAPDKYAPLLGEHSQQVLREIGFDQTRIDTTILAGSTAEPAPASDKP